MGYLALVYLVIALGYYIYLVLEINKYYLNEDKNKTNEYILGLGVSLLWGIFIPFILFIRIED